MQKLNNQLTSGPMTMEDRAACIADLAAPGTVRGAERQRRVFERALKMLREVAEESSCTGKK